MEIRDEYKGESDKQIDSLDREEETEDITESIDVNDSDDDDFSDLSSFDSELDIGKGSQLSDEELGHNEDEFENNELSSVCSLASETPFSLADYLDDSDSEIWEGWRTSSESEDQNHIYVYEESVDDIESYDSSVESNTSECLSIESYWRNKHPFIQSYRSLRIEFRPNETEEFIKKQELYIEALEMLDEAIDRYTTLVAIAYGRDKVIEQLEDDNCSTTSSQGSSLGLLNDWPEFNDDFELTQEERVQNANWLNRSEWTQCLTFGDTTPEEKVVAATRSIHEDDTDMMSTHSSEDSSLGLLQERDLSPEPTDKEVAYIREWLSRCNWTRCLKHGEPVVEGSVVAATDTNPEMDTDLISTSSSNDSDFENMWRTSSPETTSEEIIEIEEWLKRENWYPLRGNTVDTAEGVGGPEARFAHSCELSDSESIPIQSPDVSQNRLVQRHHVHPSIIRRVGSCSSRRESIHQ